MRLLKQMIKRDSAFLTVMYGEDVTDEQAAALEEEIRNKYGAKTEITFIKGLVSRFITTLFPLNKGERLC